MKPKHFLVKTLVKYGAHVIYFTRNQKGMIRDEV